MRKRADLAFRAVGAAVAAGVLTLAACGPSTAPLLVEVREAATKRPIEGALVAADVPSRNHPFSVATILGQTGPETSRGLTDAAGTVRLKYIPDRPVRLTVIAPGAAPETSLWELPEDAWRELGVSEVRAR